MSNNRWTDTYNTTVMVIQYGLVHTIRRYKRANRNFTAFKRILSLQQATLTRELKIATL